MRSIKRRAGWSIVAKKSGSLTATRSTGICSLANQTRIAAGMPSSVRMLWNIIATISMVARSLGEVAASLSACLRCWNSANSCGAVTGAARPLSPCGARRWRMPRWALLIARDSASPTGRRSWLVFEKLGRWRPISRFSRPSTASACSLPPRASGEARVIIRVSSPTPRPLSRPESSAMAAPVPVRWRSAAAL